MRTRNASNCASTCTAECYPALPGVHRMVRSVSNGRCWPDAGRRAAPLTPAGVPVKIRSPACSSKQRRELGHDLGHAPDQLGKVGVLSRLAIDLEPDATRGGVTTVRHGTDRRDRGRVIERLGDVPGQSVVFGVRLQVATRQVIADRITEHVLERLGRRDVLAALADRDDEFHLVVQVRRGGCTHRRAVRDHCVGKAW